MKIRKRNGAEQDFDIKKIINAVKKANSTVSAEEKLTEQEIADVANSAKDFLEGFSFVNVQQIHDAVEKSLMKHNCFAVAKSYVIYRDEKLKKRKFSEDEEKIIAICNAQSEDVSGDNANKRATVLGTMRDYIAGVKCKTIGRKILPKDVVSAHDKGIIHFHDMDYSPVMPEHNCSLINTFDMFKNGFQMNDTWIEPPHSFLTGSNLQAQVNLIVSGSQYGGQTVSWSALAPFVDISRKRIEKKYKELFPEIEESRLNEIVEKEVKKEVEKGVETYQYQCICHTSSNGQSPFVSVVLNLLEAKTEQELKDLALIIEAVLKERIKGVKDKSRKYTAPLFPKLLYIQAEGYNVNPEDPYYYLTVLAAKCNVHRMQPDYISAKKSREAKDGMVIPCMGCVSGDSRILVSEDEVEEISFEEAWDKLSKKYEVKEQERKGNYYIDLDNVSIWDNRLNSFVECKRIIRNISSEWYKMTFSSTGRFIELNATADHPFTNINGENVSAEDLNLGDKIYGGKDGSLVFTLIKKVGYVNEDYSYDVTTESEHFMVNELYSHNCRSFLTPYRHEVQYTIHKDISPNMEFKLINLSTKITPEKLWKEYTEKEGIIPVDNKIHPYLVCTNYGIIDYMEKKEDGVYIYTKGLIKSKNGKVIDWETGVNYEILPEPNKDYICLSLKPKNIESIPEGSFAPYKIVYNYQGNTGYITKKEGDTITCIEPKTYGRYNQGVVSANLAFIALLSKKTGRDFWEVLDEYCELIRKALKERNASIKKIKAKNAPILWVYGGLARLDPEEDLSSMLNDLDYTTMSFGYIGLYETCMALIGKSNTSEEGQELSLKILRYLNDKCDAWKKEDGIPYSIYGTPSESLTEKAAIALKREFGAGIPGVTDHDYVTNSYHVNPAEKISPFDKLALEGKYLSLSKGGAVSYVEATNLENNVEGILAVTRFMYDNILYAEINTKIGRCFECGYEGELILEKNEAGKYLFRCPKCGCVKQNKLSQIMRICGYCGEAASGIGENSLNVSQGRAADFAARYVHMQ